jgi:spermidine/putrescine transport system permease protein
VGNTTLPLYIYGGVRFGVTPAINAISTLIVAGTGIVLLVAWRLTSRRDDARPIDAAG